LAKPNYQFEKRQKELAKKRKQEEKRLQKLADKAAGSGDAEAVGAAVVSTDNDSAAGETTPEAP
jgi:hypothetical protein